MNVIIKIYKNLLPILSVIAIITYSAAIYILMKNNNLNTELFLGVTGGLIALLGFLAERYEKIIATRVELQTDFYKQWRDLRKNIRKLKEKKDEAKGMEKFIEYFQFLNHEFDMRNHLNPRFIEFYETYRKNEFQDLSSYGGKTHKEWWDKISVGRFTNEFTKYINEIINQGS